MIMGRSSFAVAEDRRLEEFELTDNRNRMRRQGRCWLMLLMAGLASWPEIGMTGDEASGMTAAQMMQTAHAGRAEWKSFPGFTATVQVSTDDATTNGKLSVTRDGKVELQLDHPEGFEWVERSIKSLVGHRLPGADAIQAVVFADDQLAHPHGRLLRSTGADDQSLWRVQGDVLTEVQRFSKDSRFVISVSDVWRNAEQQHLPKNFVVTTWEMPSEKIKSVRQVHQDWVRVGEFDLPVRYWALTQRSDGPSSMQEIKFSDQQLVVSTAKLN
jgi:hypothetical protein